MLGVAHGALPPPHQLRCCTRWDTYAPLSTCIMRVTFSPSSSCDFLMGLKTMAVVVPCNHTVAHMAALQGCGKHCVVTLWQVVRSVTAPWRNDEDACVLFTLPPIDHLFMACCTRYACHLSFSHHAFVVFLSFYRVLHSNDSLLHGHGADTCPFHSPCHRTATSLRLLFLLAVCKVHCFWFAHARPRRWLIIVRT